MRKIVNCYCLYCGFEISKNGKYCSSKCGKMYRKYKLNVVDFKKYDLKRRTKQCEICDNFFIDNTRSLCRLHCSISCQNHKYYYANQKENINRAKEYRLLNPDKVKEINKISRMKYNDRHKIYMKEWHNIRKLKEALHGRQ